MKPVICLLAFSASCLGILGSGAAAALQPTPIVSSFESTGDVLMAGRLRNRLRFRVSASPYRRGGFSRGACPSEGAYPVMPLAEAEAAVPIVATDDQGTTSYLTASSHPTFLMKVPALENASGVLYIESPTTASRNPQVYKAAFDLDVEAGIVGIQMPSDAPALEEGNRYGWRVVISCGADDKDSTITFRGGEVTRVADVSGSVEERLGYYLDEGIWQETAEILARDRYQTASAAADEDWAALMAASGISQFAETPIVGMISSTLPAE